MPSDVCLFFPRDIQHESLKGVHSHWRHSFSFVNNHYLFLACFLIVLLSIMLYLLRLRRIHRRTAQRCGTSSVPWLEEGLGSPTLPINLWTLERVKSKQFVQFFQASRHSVWDGGMMGTFETSIFTKKSQKIWWTLSSGRTIKCNISCSSPLSYDMLYVSILLTRLLSQMLSFAVQNCHIWRRVLSRFNW